MDYSDLLIAVAVNNDKVLGDNLLESPLVRQKKVPVIVRKNYTSAGCALNSVLDAPSMRKVVICAHQDVYLPPGWEFRLFSAIEALERKSMPWAVLGVYGVSLGNHRAGRVWSTGLGREVYGDIHLPVEALSLDEVVLVLNRDSGLRFDEQLPGFHLYGTDVVQQGRSQGMQAFVIDAPVIHNSLTIRCLGRDYWRSYLYCRKKWFHALPIETSVVALTRLGGELLKHNLGAAWQRLRGDNSKPTRHKDPASLASHLGYNCRW